MLASSVSSTQDLDQAFFSEHFLRVLGALGYVVWRRWRVYGEEGLAGMEATLWLRDKTLTIEHGGEQLSRYEVEFTAGTQKPRALTRPCSSRARSPSPNGGSSGSTPLAKAGG